MHRCTSCDRGAGARTRTRARHALFALLWIATISAPAYSAHAAGEKRERPQLTESEATAAVDSVERAPDAEAPSAPGEPAPRGIERRHKTVAYDMVKLGENVHVHRDEVVRGDVVVLGGNLRVEGAIQGSAVVVGGDISAGPEAEIGGEAFAVGGRVDAAQGADVRGGIVSLSFLPTPLLRGFDWTRAQHVTSLVADLFQLGFLALAAALFLIFVPDRLVRAQQELEHAFLKCFGLGILALTGGLFAVVVTSILLFVTIIGIPMSLLVAFLAVVLLLGSLVVGALLVGEKVCEALRIRRRAPLLAAFLGLVTLLLPDLLADVLRFAFAFSPASLVLQLLHAAVVVATLSGGLGALVLTRLGAQPAAEPGARFPGPVAPRGGEPAGGPRVAYEPFHEAEPPRES